MKVASRYMPPYEELISWKSRLISYAIISILVVWLIFGIYQEPMFGLFLLAIAIFVWIASEYERLNIEALKKTREGEDIGSFARSFDYRTVDTWIIRAVYEEINNELGFDDNSVPIRASDNLEKDLKIDDEDLFFIYDCVASRASVSDENIENNPYYNKVKTVKDLVLFMDAQPKCRE